MLIDELKNLKLKNWSAVLKEDEILWLELNKVHKSTNTLSSEVREEFGKFSVFLKKEFQESLVKNSSWIGYSLKKENRFLCWSRC